MRPALASLAAAALLWGCKASVPAAPVDAGTPTAATAAAQPAIPGAPDVPVTIPPVKGPVTHLVVMLHGYGADAQSFARISRMMTSRLSTAEVLIPDGFDPYEGGASGRQWFSRQGNLEAERPARVAQAGQRLSAWLDAELQRRGLLADRLVVVGFSQGGMLAGWLALNRGQRPAAVVVMSGQVVQPAEAAPPARGRAAPVLVVHGEADRVIPVDVVDPGVQLLEAAGLKVTRRVWPGLGHGVQVDELNEIALFLAEATGQR